LTRVNSRFAGTYTYVEFPRIRTPYFFAFSPISTSRRG
jgi:hypothetical protein